MDAPVHLKNRFSGWQVCREGMPGRRLCTFLHIHGINFKAVHHCVSRCSMCGTMSLSQMDLNLLVALDALLREKNVTKAGEAIGLSQPAMSSALARLRR